MAIQYTFTSSHGVTANSAYHKIYKIEYNVKRTNSAIVYAEVYYDASSYSSGKDPIDVVEFEFTMSVGDSDLNLVKQAYNAMKTKTKVKDSRGRTKSIDYTHRDVRDV
tara:strand:- start:697 stop:1020 length:324 start_codon:yes stop_codon:yes gene_type:complete